MAWNPEAARTHLNRSGLLTFVSARDKLSSFKTSSGRELALLEENKSKVSIYVSRCPKSMPDIVVEKHFPPSKTKSGRHSNLQYITETLGFDHSAYRVRVKSQAGLELFLNWYQYA